MAMAKINDHSKPMSNRITRSFWKPIYFSPELFPIEVFLRKGVLKICCKFTGKHPCRSVISIKLLCNFIEITFRHECSSVNWLHILRIPLS